MRFQFPSLNEALDFTNGSLFRLFVEEEGSGPATLSAKDFTMRKDSSAPIWRFEKQELCVTIALQQRDAEWVGTITVDNANPRCVVTRVQFPYIAYSQVAVFDRLLLASSWGDDIPRPSRAIKHYCDGRDKGFWIYDYVKAGEDEISYAYPSIMAMQFMALYNPSRTLYLACYGLGNDTRTFNAQLYARDGLGLSVNHYPYLGAGGWTSPECAFALLPGGWRVAADVYGRTMRQHFPAPERPRWMSDEREGFHGWVQFMMRREGQPAQFKFRDLPELARRARAVGLNILHIGGWTYDGFDTYYPNFEHDPILGSAADLRAALEQIRREGSRCILYTNGRVIDPRSEFYKSGGDKTVCLDSAGKPYIERYNTSAEFRVACPACTSFGDYMAGRIRNMIAAYGAHAAQVDQISCNHAYFCHDKSHPHPTPASNFLQGIEHELKAIRSAHQAADSDFFIWCEGCHERFAQFYDVNQGHGEEFAWALGDALPELFTYVYPDQLVTGLCRDIQAICHSFAQGRPLDVLSEMLDVPEYVQLLQQLVAIRKKYPAYFLHGKFIADAGLEVLSPVRAFGLERRDGKGLLVNLWQRGAEAGTKVNTSLRHVRAARPAKRIWPADLTVARDGDWLTLTWTGPIATVEFEGE